MLNGSSTCTLKYVLKIEPKEKPLEFITPLQEATCNEGDTVTFTCEVSQDKVKPTWTKDGKKLVPSEDVIIESVGKVHKLTLKNATLDDRAEYTISVKDKESTAPLFVEESPLVWVVPLRDRYDAAEGDLVSMICEVNKPGVPAMWLKDGEQITVADGYEIIMDGCRHILRIPSCELEDDAEYTVMVGDLESITNLFVEEVVLEFTHKLSDGTFTEGEMFELSCELSRPDVPVTWLKNRKPLTPSDRIRILCERYRHVLQIMEAIPEDEGEYTLLLPNNTETSAVIKVKEKPAKFTKPLEETKAKEGDNVTLTCKLDKQNVFCTWLKDGKELQPGDGVQISSDGYTQQLILTDVTIKDAAKYTCVCGDVSTEATLLVEEAPATFTKPLTDLTTKERDTVTLTCELSKPNTPCKWFKNDTEIQPSNHAQISYDGYTQQLVLTDVTVDDTAKYSCVCGDVSSEATLQVQESLKFIRELSEMRVIEEQTVTLECEVNQPGLTATWLKDKQPVVLKKSDSIRVKDGMHSLVIASVEIDDEAEYTVQIGELSSSAPLFVEEALVEFIKPLKDIQIMEKTKVVLECEVSKPNLIATWYVDGEEIKSSDRVELVVYDTVHQLIIETAKLTDEGKYTIDVEGQKSSATLLVDESPVELVARLHDIIVPAKGSAVFECEVSLPGVKPQWYKDEEPITVSDGYDIRSDGTHHYLYLDKVGPDDIGDYTIQFDDVECTASLQIEEPPLKITKPLEKKEVPEKEPLTLSCEVSKPGVMGKWFKDNKEILSSEHIKVIDDENVHKLEILDATLSDSGTYKCKLEDKETTCKVTVKEKPLEFVKPLKDIEVTEGQDIVLECVVSKEGLKASWQKNGKALPVDNRIKVTADKDTHRLAITSAMVEDKAEYTVKVADKSSTAKVFVEEEVVEFVRKLSDVEVKEIPSTVTFECELSKPDIVAKWFRDGKPLGESDKFQMVVDGTVHKLVITDVDGEDEGDYSIVARGKKSEGELIVEVPPQLFLDKQFEEEVVLKAGQSTAFEIPFKGNPQPKATWTYNNEPLPQEKRIESETIYNMTTLRLGKVKRSDTGNYTLTLDNSAGKVSITIKLTVLDKPTAPQDLKPSEVTADSITLTWQTPADNGGSEILEHIIEKKEFNRRTWQQMGTTKDLTFTIPKLLEGNQYFFKVAARNDIGIGEAAETKEAITAKNPFVVPDAPEAPVVSDITSTSATISWQPPANDGGSPITGYRLERISGFSGRWVPISKELLPETTFSVTDLVESNTYEFRVIAENKAGPSKPSPPSQNIKAVNPWTKPNAPGTPEIIKTDKTSADLKWTPPTEDGGAPITNYVIEYRPSGAVRWNRANSSPVTETTFSVADLKERSEYEFRVSAENKAGVGPASEPSKSVKVEKPLVGTAPKVLENLCETTIISPEPVTLKCVLEFGEPVAEVKWFKGPKEIKKNQKYTMNIEDKVASLIIQETEPQDAGVYRCQAINPLGQCQTEATLAVHTHPKLEYENKLKAKQLVKVGQSISLQVNISGIPNPTVQWAQNGTVIEKSPKISIETTDVFSMLTVKNASLDDTGVYSITAENVVGKAQAEFDVAIRDKPGKPNNLQVMEVMKESVVLSWQPPTNTGGSDIIGYTVEKRDAKRNTWAQVANIDSETTTYAVQKLIEGNEYFFRVSAKNDMGTGESAEIDRGTVAKCPYDVPGAPRNLQPTEVNKSSVTLTWEVPEQDGGSPVTGYIVERRQTTATRWTKAHKQTLTETVFTATDLVEMSEYEFRVAAENAAGIGKPCEPVGPILTQSPYDVPDAPAKPQITNITKDTATLTWTPPEKDGGSPVFNYVIECKPVRASKWISASHNITVANTRFTVKDLTEGMEYEFRVLAENKAGLSKPSAPSSVIVREPVSGEAPSVLEGLPDISVLLGEDATLECQISGKPEPSVTWSKDSHRIDVSKKYEMSQDEVSVSLTIRDVSEKDSGSYTLEASNDLGSVSTSGQLDVQAKPELEFDNKFRDVITLNTGTSLRIPVTYKGLPKPTITWGKDEKPLKAGGSVTLDTKDTLTTLQVKKVTRADDGLYFITAENEAGKAKATFDVEVIDVPDQPEGPIKISDINRDRVTLSWAPPKDDGGSKIKSYTVERREQGRSMWSKVDTVDASKTSIVATGLSQGKEYFFRIYAENDIGLSKPLESKQAVIPKSPFGMCETVFSPTSEQGFFLKF